MEKLGIKNFANSPVKNVGYSKYVELAHVKAISSFPETATLGEINDPSNIFVLCPNCHRELDRRNDNKRRNTK